jgi:hypothetical protein
MTKFSESNIKVLKKCKECGIYPSLTTSFERGRIGYSYICPKCTAVKSYLGDVFKAQERWNKANGFDENDESTWNDGEEDTDYILKRADEIHEETERDLYEASKKFWGNEQKCSHVFKSDGVSHNGGLIAVCYKCGFKPLQLTGDNQCKT